jgi:hypothetical protein
MACASPPPRPLSKVDFGAPAAERDIERGLDEYFVESEAYRRVKAGTKRILIGGRGIGKSALFQVLGRRERDAGSYVIELSPEDYSYELLTQTMASEARGSWAKHGAYAAAWKYLIYVLIASPGGDVLWVSGGLPGSVHDKKAEWIWGVLAELEAAGLVTLADKGYQGSAYAKVPYRGTNKPESQKQANKAHAKLRSPGERANAQLKTWHILRKLRCCPWRAGQLVKAIHVLQVREANAG